VNSADKQYELHLCEQVLDLSRIVYVANSDEFYPTTKQVMLDNKGASVKENRDQIQENIDFLRVSLGYSMLDIEALRRENAELKKSRGK